MRDLPPADATVFSHKKAKTNGVVAVQAVAYKLARACYDGMRDHVPFDVAKAFG